MKSSKSNSLQRLVSIVMIAVLLICAIGFAANGWQLTPNNQPDSGENGDTADNTDENTDGTNSDNTNSDNNSSDENQTPPPVEIPPPPVYFSTVTGIEITEEVSFNSPLGFVLNPSSPVYGISSSDLSIEFPIEDGSTRLLTYTQDTSFLWKIGAIMPSRDFISGMTSFFGGTVISYGNDGIMKYSAPDSASSTLDLSKYSDCYYVENYDKRYSSKDMINVALNRDTSLIKSDYKTPPYLFADSEFEVLGNREAASVIIPYSSTSETQFYFSESSGEYLYFKSGNRKVDMLSGKNVSFKNVFILFADAITYEKSEGTELVIDTISGGSGYYFTGGTMTEFKWSVDDKGNLLFKTLSGDILTVNRGKAYIGFVKASGVSSLKFA